MEIVIANYTVKISSAGLNGFWAEVPVLQGCFSQGDSFEEIVENTEEAIDCHISGLRSRGIVIAVESQADVESVLLKSPRRWGIDPAHLVELLLAAGFENLKQSRHHVTVKKDEEERQVTIPIAGCDLPPKLVKCILEKAGISPQYFRELRFDLHW
jgi:predicted RNase H-like HicB family nuclease/predicted RNA binding protein YcfA (HicA-like mRNA interferase family)